MIRLQDIDRLLTEAAEVPTSVTKYLPKEAFEKFQVELSKIIEVLKKDIGGKMLGRTVTFRGAKGFGQIEQDHSAVISDVDVVLYQDKYTLLLKGSEGKSRKQNEYYIDPTSPVFMKISRGTPTQDVSVEPEKKPQPAIRKVVNPTNIPSKQAQKVSNQPRVAQPPQQQQVRR